MLNEYTIKCIESSQRALVIFKDGTYQITSVIVPMIEQSQRGHFRAAYPDHYFFGDRCFYLDRIDRKNNTVILKESE